MPHYDLFQVRNQHGIMLSVLVIVFDREAFPTVVYLHGNGGHKMEALQLATGRVNIVAFDFAACGKSQGDYLTYGEQEARDVSVVVTEARKRYSLGKVVIWGRSMGASIGIMYASMFPK